MNWKKLLKAIASSSHCNRRKVGCIISKEGRIISTGYNGMPKGFLNPCEEDNITKQEVIHAEANAILFSAKHGVSTKGATLYVTTAPCIECSKMIIQSGIAEVIYQDKYNNTTGIDLLRKAGIVVRNISND